MNDTPGSSIEELQQQIRSLRTFLLATLAVLVLLGFALNVFIFRQVSIAGKQLEANQKYVGEYNKVSVPLINDFLTKITAVSKTNAEIGRLLAKYNIQAAASKPGGASTKATNPSLTPLAAPTTEPYK